MKNNNDIEKAKKLKNYDYHKDVFIKLNIEDKKYIDEALDLYNYIDNMKLNKPLGDMTLNDICAYFLDKITNREDMLKKEKDEIDNG